jgi:hypothetical protein
MAELESLTRRLGGGGEVLDQLGERLGGSVRDLGWRTLAELAPVGDGKLAYFAATVSPGSASAPYHDQSAIQIVAVDDRKLPEPIDFESALPAVRAAYRDRLGQRLYAAAVERLLDEGGYRILPGGLALVTGIGIESTKIATQSATKG